MTNTSYTSNTIFENPQVNALCDFLFTKLIAQFPPVGPDVDNDKVYKGIVLSGHGADIMQGATEAEIKNITFEIDQADIYTWLAANLGKIFNCRVITFKERLLFYPFENFFFEIWWVEDIDGLHEIADSGIWIQQNTYINHDTLPS